MTMRKLVGAVVALTMASSLFAGFTTVVNADGANEENNQEVTFVTDMTNRKVTCFKEAEDLIGATEVENPKCSGGKGAYFTEDTEIVEVTLQPGIYQIEAGVIGDGSKNITIKIEPPSMYDELEMFYYKMECSTAGDYKAYTKDAIILRYESNVIITASDESNLLDYIYITEPEVTISAVGIFDFLEGTPVRAYTAKFEMDEGHAPVTGIEFTVGKCVDGDEKLLPIEGTEKKVSYNFSGKLTGEGNYVVGILVHNDNAYEIATPTAVLITATEELKGDN